MIKRKSATHPPESQMPVLHSPSAVGRFVPPRYGRHQVDPVNLETWLWISTTDKQLVSLANNNENRLKLAEVIDHKLYYQIIVDRGHFVIVIGLVIVS